MKAGVIILSSVVSLEDAPIIEVDRPMTIAEWIESACVEIPRTAILSKSQGMAVGDDDYVLRSNWDVVVIKDGDVLVFTPMPLLGGGGGGGKMFLQIILVVVVIALAVVTGGAAASALAAPGVLGATGTFLGLTAVQIGQIVTAVILIAGTMVLNAIFAPDTPDAEKGSNAYNLTNQQNLARLGAVIPVLYGTFRFYPYLIAQPYSEHINGTSWLYLFMVITQGEADIDEIRMEETPLARFDRAAYDYEILPPYTPPTLFPVAVLPSPAISNQELRGAGKTAEELNDARQYDQAVDTVPWLEPWSGPHVLADRGVAYSRVAMDVSFPAGLIHISDMGDRKHRSATIACELQELGFNDNEIRKTDAFLDRTYFDNGTAFTGGPCVVLAGREQYSFYMYFDHHPGFLTKRSRKDNLQGDTDVTVRDKQYWTDEARAADKADDGKLSPYNEAPLERYQTINLHFDHAECDTDSYGNKNVMGVPVEVFEACDLQVLEMETCEYGEANGDWPSGATEKTNVKYWRASIAAPVTHYPLDVWRSGVEYSVGMYAGRTLNDLSGPEEPLAEGDELDAQYITVTRYRCAKTHTATEANKPPPYQTNTGDYVPPAWLTGTLYAVGAYVSSGVGTLYQCQTQHTSGTFATDLAAGKWKRRDEGAGAEPIWVMAQVDYPNEKIGYVTHDVWKMDATAGQWAGTGGKNIKYSKWYGFGVRSEGDWGVATTELTGEPNLNRQRLIVATPARASYPMAGASTALQERGIGVADMISDRYAYGSKAVGVDFLPAIPQPTMRFTAATSNPFVKTVSSSVEDIMDEATGVDEFGVKIGDGSPVRRSVKYARFQMRARQNTRENFQNTGGHTRINAMSLIAVKLYLPERKHYGNITTMAVKLKASYGFNSSTKNKLNVVATRRLSRFRDTDAVAITSLTVMNKYGLGAVALEFESATTAAKYKVGDIVNIDGIVEAGYYVGGVPAAMYAGWKRLLAQISSTSFLVMPEKVVRVRSDADSLTRKLDAMMAPAWVTSTLYKVGDMVSRNGVNYRCTTQHTSGAGTAPPHANWASLAAYTVVTTISGGLAPGTDGPDNLAGMGLRINNTGQIYYREFGKRDFSIGGENSSAIVRVNMPGHDMHVGDDFQFSNVPDSVINVSGLGGELWYKARHEAGSSFDGTLYTDLRRTAHTVSRVIDDDNFEITLTTMRPFVEDIADLEVEMKSPGSIPPSLGRFYHVLEGGKHYAVPAPGILEWSSATTYASGASVKYQGTVWLSLSNGNTNRIPATGSAYWTPSVGLGQEYSDPTPVVSNSYVGGRMVAEPHWFRGTKLTFSLGEWCRHRPNGAGPVRYWKSVYNGTMVISDFTPAERIPGANPAYWVEVNRAAEGDPTWYFDIVSAANGRYEISAGGGAWSYDWTETFNGTQVGLLFNVGATGALDLGKTTGERFRIAKPVEYEIIYNTDKVIAIELAPQLVVQDTVQVVLKGTGVTDGGTSTGQVAMTVDTGAAGAWQPPVRTQEISSAFNDILHDTTYGVGLPDDEIDIAGLEQLELLWSGRGDWAGTDRDPAPPPAWQDAHVYAKYDRVSLSISQPDKIYYAEIDHTSSSTTRPDQEGAYGYWRETSPGVRDTFNGVFDKSVSAWNALQAVAGVGRAAPTIVNGTLVTAVRDDYKTVPKQMFGDRNILPGSLKVNYIPFTDEENDSLAIRYVDSRTWKEDEVLAFAADPANPFYYCAGYIEGNVLTATPRLWSNVTTYRKNEYVTVAGGDIYISKFDNNLNHSPSTPSTVWWSLVAGDIIFTPEYEMDTVTWEDGTDLTIISQTSELQVIVSLFDRKGTAAAPEDFTILKGTHANPASIEGIGFTSRKQAWREAKFRVDATRNRRASIAFSTELEGLRCTYGDRVVVEGLWGQSGDVLDYSTSMGDGFLELDRDLIFKDESGLDYPLAPGGAPVTVKRGSKVVYFQTATEHRVYPGLAISFSLLSGTIGGINLATAFNTPVMSIVHTVEDEYTFTVIATATATADASGGGSSGLFSVNYDTNVLQAALRKPDGSVVGPMAMTFYKSPGDPDYFRCIQIDPVDLDGFVPVFDEDQEKTHYLIGVSDSFKRDCRVVSMIPSGDKVDLTVMDDGDNSHYESDLTYKYTEDTDYDVIPQTNVVPQFQYSYDEYGQLISPVSVAMYGTAAEPYAKVSWTSAGAVYYRVQMNNVLDGLDDTWEDVANVSGYSVDVPVQMGRFVTFRVYPVSWSEGIPAYYSGVARFDPSGSAALSFPGQVIRTGRNMDIEPLDDQDETTIAASQNRVEHNPSGIKNGYNKNFTLAERPIDPSQVVCAFGTPAQSLRYVRTEANVCAASAGLTPPYSSTEKVIRVARPYLGSQKTSSLRWRGVQVGDRVSIAGGGLYIDLAYLATLDSPGVPGWSNVTAYVIGNYVSYLGVYYRCILGHTNHVPPNSTYWAVLNDGDLVASVTKVEAETALWQIGVSYSIGDIVEDEYDNKYSSLTNHTSDMSNSPPDPATWQEVTAGYEITGSMLQTLYNEWSDATTYSAGANVSWTVNGRVELYTAARASTNKEPGNPDVNWELYWNYIPVDEWPADVGLGLIEIDLDGIEFEDGFSNTCGAVLTDLAHALPRLPFYVVPNEDRVYVYDPNHGLAQGFCETSVAFWVDDAVYGDPDYTICGIPKDYVLNPQSSMSGAENLLVHKIYVLTDDVYYFIPQTTIGTRLTAAQIPDFIEFGGTGIYRHKLPLVKVHPPLGLSDFTVYGNKLKLGIAPRASDELTLTYAGRGA